MTGLAGIAEGHPEVPSQRREVRRVHEVCRLDEVGVRLPGDQRLGVIIGRRLAARRIGLAHELKQVSGR